MKQLDKSYLAFHVLITFFAFLTSLPILGLIAGGAAFGGVNLVLSLYLIFGMVGSIGLLFGVFTIYAKNPLFAWFTAVSSAFVGVLSLLLLGGFLFSRERGVPLNDPLYIGRAPVPLIALYVFAFLFCVTTVWISVERIRQLREV